MAGTVRLGFGEISSRNRYRTLAQSQHDEPQRDVEQQSSLHSTGNREGETQCVAKP